jgi:hypothetical protein
MEDQSSAEQYTVESWFTNMQTVPELKQFNSQR